MAEEIKLSPIHEAAKRGYVDQMEEILEKLTNQAEKEKLISSADTYGNTPLHWAASGGHDEAVSYILKLHKANINSQNLFGDTALHRAAWRGNDKVCKILVENGANNSKTMHNKEGKIPLDLARKYEVRVIVSPPQDFGDDEELDMEDADSD